MSNARMNPIAVIGMACRLPGGIDSPDLLWEALLRGDDLITEIPADRWDADEYYDPEPGVRGRTVSRWGGFLDDIAGFDFEFFGIGEREATAIDPQHRLLLETSWEAVEHAGLAPKSLAGSQTGVFVGLAHDDYAFVTGDAGALGDAYAFTGTPFNMASGRVAWAMGLRGPAVTFDTSCSSGLLAVHLACRSLQDGECDLALAGGCSVLLEPRAFASASGLGMLSPTGRCRTFDVAADGWVRSEGCVVVLLKQLALALSDGDRILAVLRGTAANQDGRTGNILTPSLDAQMEVYRAALGAAGVGAGTVGMVEAHGTGTPVGDPIEFRSLAAIYGTHGPPCAIGSVKSNLGHTESAAGAVGLMKAILAVRHGVVPPMAHFSRLPDDLAQIETNLFVPQEITSWPSDDNQVPRRAAVSSFGMSGTNVHAILEQPPHSTISNGGAAGSGLPSPMLFALSSTSADGLRRTARRLDDWVQEHEDSIVLPDLAYTLARRRAHRPVRAAVIAADRGELLDGLRQVAEGDVPYQDAVGQDDRGPVWVFSGQGSQWEAMGADLLANEPVFATTVAVVEPLIAAESGFSVTEAMAAAQTVTGLDRVQPTLFAMQVALADTMKSYGVTPGAVVGHSMGEVAAAVVAGALSLEDGVRVICRRSRLLSRLAGSGAMASVDLPARQVRAELEARGVTDVVVSVVASPQSTVIGGAAQTVRDLVAAWEQREVMAREVAVDVASHCPQVDPILDELSAVLAEVAPMAPQLPFYSATLFDQSDRPVCDAAYWVENLRHTVRFGAAMQAAMEDGHRVFAELAPHPLLTRAVEQTAASLEMPVAVLAGMRREQPLPHGMRGLLADLHNVGAAVDFSALYPGGRLVDAPLPAWTHRRLLLVADRRAHQANTVAAQPLLGAHVPLPEEPERHAWHSDVGIATLPWLDDHRIHDVAAFPGAAYCEMALAAARTVLGEGSEVRDIRFEQMLLLADKTPVFAQGLVTSPGVADFVVETVQEGQRIQRAAAVLHAGDAQDQPPHYDMADLLATYSFELDWAELRQWFDDHGVHHGPVFTGVTAAHAADSAVSTILADIALPGSIRSQQSGYGIHPALLDACFQSAYAHPAAQSSRDLLLPLGVRRIRAYAPTRNARYCHTTITNGDAAGVVANLDVLDEHGMVLLAVRGLQLGAGATEHASRDRVLSERLLTIEWQPRELPEVRRAEAQTWLLVSAFADPDVVATEVADALKLHGAQCTVMCWPQHGDPVANAERLRGQLGAGGFTGVVVFTEPHISSRDEESAVCGAESVWHIVRLVRELPEIAGELPRLYVVTMNAQAVLDDDVVNLEQGGLRGLLRVIGAEHPQLRPTQIDIEEQTDVALVARQLLAGSNEDETAWRHDGWFTARLCPNPLRPEERRTTIVDHERDGMRLQIRAPGDLQTMESVAFDRVSPGPGQIEVAVSASSVNFADVLATFGRCPSFEGQPPQLGIDFAGVVTRVGPDVADHRVGDRVGGMSPNGCWGTFVTCDARVAATLPPGLTDAQAASVTTAYATAWYGLRDLARVRAGDMVLIHSATGGVGQAAIAIARAAGATIFATAGSPQRRALLHDMGIEHVYDSRSVDFAAQIRRDSDGYGVDIVLNSLTGAAHRAGIELLAMGGRFVEIGKRDISGDSKLGLFPFRRNLSFHGVDLALLAITHPARVRELLDTVYTRTADRSLPIPQSTHYPLAEAATAIQVMSAAQHTGKLILDIPRAGSSTVALPPELVPVFRGDGSYIITGGLGGLGLFFAEKMAVAGCGRIVLNSRSAPNQKALKTIERIRAIGSEIVVQCGDIARPGMAVRLVSLATANGLPLRGVLHAAAVVEDATLRNITDDLIDRNWAPKVYGAWHLHQATAGLPLDWFCLFSSSTALLGPPGQGAYVAANSWLDAFTHWRRAQGLQATAIAWGPWAGTGRAAALAESGDTKMITPDDGAHAFGTLLRHTRGYAGYTPVVGSPWLTALAQRSQFAEAFQSAGQTCSGTSELRRELNELPLDEWPRRFRRLVSEQVGLLLRRTVDADRPLFEYGLDSLGNVELRNRIESETGIRINSADVTTVRGLAEHLCDTLTAQVLSETS
ncbi:polyketide synthase [Mycobacterium sp. 1245111.1]|uniref:sulfolipid-1 biosynthesis phthioceranic/hydroxyphthioceranic acid synthase n=1 Tax=Mycobacterium sp. 1245111.1 TaxID=1834073 RepID=UPI00080115B6|nr:type I polyketide synthase [Mycobacterium sp. 1245111.1]OBK34768.1 polyketide synthase [Mycobacterium sp. 1245111.1]